MYLCVYTAKILWTEGFAGDIIDEYIIEWGVLVVWF